MGYLNDIGIEKDFKIRHNKAQIINAKIDIFDCLEIKNFSASQDSKNEMQIQATTREDTSNTSKQQKITMWTTQ